MFDVLPVTSPQHNDCGPTCMKMLLTYYNIDVDLDQLIEECNCKITGCTGKDLLECGRKHDLDMTAWKMDAEEVIRQDRPSIIWWKYCHWCVCCGMDDQGKVVICNPDIGRYRMAADTFKGWYSGVALFNGTPETLPEGAEQATADDLLNALRGLGVEIE